MPLANKLPNIVRRPLRRLWREALVPIRGRMRARDRDIALRVPFAPGVRDVPATPRIAVICHLFHEDLAPLFRTTLENVPAPADLFLSTDVEEKVAAIRQAFAGWEKGRVDIRVLPNRGRDIAPKLAGFVDVYDDHDLVLFLHSKKSLTAEIGNEWRDVMLQTLCGSREIVDSIVTIFERHPGIGIVCAQHFEPIRGLLHWDGNFPIARDLAGRMGFRIARRMTLDFPSGSMFWARPAALRPLLDLNLTFDDFPPEANQVRATPQHAIERLFLLVAESAGFRWVKVSRADDRARETIRPIADLAALDAFVADETFTLLQTGVGPQ